MIIVKQEPKKAPEQTLIRDLPHQGVYTGRDSYGLDIVLLRFPGLSLVGRTDLLDFVIIDNPMYVIYEPQKCTIVEVKVLVK